MEKSAFINFLESMPISIKHTMHSVQIIYTDRSENRIELGTSNNMDLTYAMMPNFNKAHTMGANDGFKQATGLADTMDKPFKIDVYPGNEPIYQFSVKYKDDTMFNIGNLALQDVKNLVHLLNTVYELSAQNAELIMKNKITAVEYEFATQEPLPK